MGEFDLSLISEFRNHPSFYDRNSPRFRDKLYNAHVWQQISNKLGFDVSILKDRILQLRNRYNLEKRRIEQLREENPNTYFDSPWPLYEHLHFLSDHIRARRSYKKMLTSNGNSGGSGMAGGADNRHFPTGLELSNSGSNSNLTLRHITDSESPSRAGAIENREQITAFPNGLLTVKMEDNSDGTEEDTESRHNGSEINAFETSGLIPNRHSPVNHHLQQQNHSALKQQHQQKQQPTISIRRLDSLKQDFADSLSSVYAKKQKKKLHHQYHHPYQQQQKQQQRTHHTSSTIKQSQSLQNDNESGISTTPPRQHPQPPLSAREMKYTAFGSFISSSLLDLPPNAALELVEKFTSDIVKVLMENAQQQVQKEQLQQQEKLQQQQQEQYCNDLENSQ